MSLSSEAAIGIGFAGFLGCCLCLILGILLRRHRSRQRIAVTSIKQLQHLFSSMDTDRSGCVDTSEFIAGFRMPDDMYTASLVTMMDADDNGHITFHEMVECIARFHGCTTTHAFAFTLLDARATGAVPKAKVQMVLRGVLVAVLRERAKLKFSEKYNTKQVMNFMKDMREGMTIEDFEHLEMRFPGAFGGVAIIWEQFEDVVERCARIVADGGLNASKQQQAWKGGAEGHGGEGGEGGKGGPGFDAGDLEHGRAMPGHRALIDTDDDEDLSVRSVE